MIRAQAKDALARALIIGDSISIGYTKPVTDLLKGKVAVSPPKANCGDTRDGIAKIDKWLGDGKWNVIHFNWGLHDLCYRNPKSKEQRNRENIKGTLSVPWADYGIPASETERYVMNPGQACAYKIGMLKILELRAKAQKALGEKFSLKEFHNTVLQTGNVPLAVLEQVFEDHIAARR